MTRPPPPTHLTDSAVRVSDIPPQGRGTAPEACRISPENTPLQSRCGFRCPPVFVGKRSQPVNISGSLLRSHPYRRDIAVFIKLRSVVGKAEELYSGFYRVFYILPLVTDRMVTPRSVSVIICCHHFGIISFCLPGAAEPGTDGNMISHIPPFVVP